MELLLPRCYQRVFFSYRFRSSSAPRLKSPDLHLDDEVPDRGRRKWPMVNPLDIMPVLALAFAVMCIPILGDRP